MARIATASTIREGRDDASWLLAFSLFFPIAAIQLMDPFSFSWKSAGAPVAFFAVLATAGIVYRRLRPDPAIVGMVTGLQQMIVFTCLGGTLSYMIAAQGGTLWDAQFQIWDETLGLNWRAYLDWVNARPLLGSIYQFAYGSLIPQMVLVILSLGFARKLDTLRIVVFAAILSGTVTILISGVTPAMSNFVFLDLKPADYPNLHPSAAFVHVSDIEGLRAGTLRALSLDTMQGIITFPSYHAALATVFAWGFAHVPFLRWPAILLAVLTLLATPIDGGHYFVDVCAGMAIAAASLWLGRRSIGFDVRTLFARTQTPLPTAIPLIVRSSPCRRSHAASGR